MTSATQEHRLVSAGFDRPRTHTLFAGSRFGTYDGNAGPMSAAPVRTRLAGSRVLARTDRLDVCLAAGNTRIDQALALRHRVFVLELGASVPLSCRPGLEHDAVDPYCEHLIVIERASERVVATSRLLMPQRAAQLGRLSADSQFRLDNLATIRPCLVELGRTCVAADHRNPTTLGLLWSGLRTLLDATDIRYLMTAASVPMSDDGQLAGALHEHLAQHYLNDLSLRVWPRRRLPRLTPDTATMATVPSLMSAYLRMGSRLLGAPCYNEAFVSADFPLIARVDRLAW